MLALSHEGILSWKPLVGWGTVVCHPVPFDITTGFASYIWTSRTHGCVNLCACSQQRWI